MAVHISFLCRSYLHAQFVNARALVETPLAAASRTALAQRVDYTEPRTEKSVVRVAPSST